MYIRPVLIPSIPVHYEADENGYRVTSMETEEIGSGPVTNKEGKAFVQSLQHGFQSTYAIMGKQGAEVATISSICISEVSPIKCDVRECVVRTSNSRECVVRTSHSPKFTPFL